MRIRAENLNIYNAHCGMRGYATGGSFRGVERVMLAQNGALQSIGYSPYVLTGETDSQNVTRDNVVLVPFIRRDQALQPSRSIVRDALIEVTDGASILFHNTLHPRGNHTYSQAAADLVDAGVRGESNPSVLWVHDLHDRRSPEEFYSLLPTENGARLAIISNARLRQFYSLIDRFHALGLVVPEFDIRLMPNPIETQFFLPETADIPDNLDLLAPQFRRMTELYHLPQSTETAERVLFGDEYVRFILPGRVARNKGAEEAINVVEAFSNQYQPAALIISNSIEMSDQDNRAYFERLLARLNETYASSHRNFEVLILGGVERKYMRWLFERCHKQLAPFSYEGFSLPILEAALSGVSSAFAEDPSMVETADGHGLSMPLTVWQREPHQVAKAVYQYMGTSGQMADLDALSAKATKFNHPEVVSSRLQEIITR